MCLFAMLFPGQGVQYINMLSSFLKKEKIFQNTFKEASEYIGYNLLKLIKKGPLNIINNSKYTQPIILTSSFAIYKFWKKYNGKNPSFMCGHSLGEYSALVCAKAIKFSDALKIVSLRGQYMQKIILNQSCLVKAIIGLDKNIIKKICRKYASKTVSIASINSDNQIIISGNKLDVHQASIECKNNGAKFILDINLNIPIHSHLMKPVSKKIESILKNIEIKKPRIPVINNVDVKCESNSENIKKALIKQVYKTVRWKEIIDFIQSKNIFTMLEIGPNNVLTNLNKKNVNLISLHTSNKKHFLQALKKIN
ncbi:[acyl-carrier-protein] S-malonyltransferase [Buchnera aphidicola (Aphis helianthi)]|uniref:Malonyl CoA-acyl carrier protein transacylase n=1 Tax=Buchnera aphidicola (Aphis helianthi) TaxID=2315802 RepID=A0A4D6XQN6_9GAMM|nr:ACP S-malonyltransferase [Buchnera aphidicola]QCI17168.1 [acyl-carrier-protein] S-malonyltransferase [Buchnera aphidicola (Aphis helianthi)]